MSMRGNEDEMLDALFRAYRDACPDPEASANFMPTLWARIDSRQTFLFSFRRMASAFVTAAVALSIALGVYMTIPRSTAATATETYVEALAEANPLDNPDIVSPAARIELNGR
jgi:ABC-type nitrate/sulfonate/bicarbonate transport system permease component